MGEYIFKGFLCNGGTTMKRSEKQCEDCIHHVNNQVGELKDLMILNLLKCSRGQDTELDERCTLYAPIKEVRWRKEN